MQPLSGVKVLDMSHFLSGPRCGQILAYLGADVVKVEPPVGDSMRLLLVATGSDRGMHTLHAGKRGLMLDLRREEDQRLFLRLIRVADVLIENLAPGVMDGLGLGYEELAARNQRLIYAAISGFGHTGPNKDRVAFDIIAQATGGAMYANHQPHQPPGVFIGDLVSGAYAALGILAALRMRDRTGVGQMIDISMQDVVYFQNFWGFVDHANEPDKGNMEAILGMPLSRLMTDVDNPMCFWNSFPTKDGYVVVVALTEKQWKALAEVTGIRVLAEDPRFADFPSRIRNTKDGIALLNPWMAQFTSDELIARLVKAKIPCGRVSDYDQLNRDEQLIARGMIAEVPGERESYAIPGNPIKMSGYSWEPERPAPKIDQHRKEILLEWLGEE